MTYTKLVNGEPVPMTAQEIAIRQAEEAAWHASQLAKYIPEYRYKREVGGVEYLGKMIQTDRETRANWIGILINAQSNPAYTVRWKTIDGSFVEYDSIQAQSAALAVSSHVQKCFDAEDAIKGQSFETYEQIEAAFEAAYSGE